MTHRGPEVERAFAAVENGDVDGLRALLDDGLDPCATNGDGWSLLHLSVDAEADSRTQSATPLEVATTALLLARGADPDLMSPAGSPADLARQMNHWLALELMACRAAPSSPRPSGGRMTSPRQEMDVAQAVAGLERDLDEVRDRIRSCVRWLVDVPADARHPVSERLAEIGVLALPALRELAADAAAPRSARVEAALVALHVGDRSSVVADVLCREVDADTPMSIAAVQAAARAGLEEARDPVQRALARIDVWDTTSVLTWTHALSALGGTLPEGVRDRIEGALPEWARPAFEQDFPPGRRERLRRMARWSFSGGRK